MTYERVFFLLSYVYKSGPRRRAGKIIPKQRDPLASKYSFQSSNQSSKDKIEALQYLVQSNIDKTIKPTSFIQELKPEQRDYNDNQIRLLNLLSHLGSNPGHSSEGNLASHHEPNPGLRSEGNIWGHVGSNPAHNSDGNLLGNLGSNPATNLQGQNGSPSGLRNEGWEQVNTANQEINIPALLAQYYNKVGQPSTTLTNPRNNYADTEASQLNNVYPRFQDLILNLSKQNDPSLVQDPRFQDLLGQQDPTNPSLDLDTRFQDLLNQPQSLGQDTRFQDLLHHPRSTNPSVGQDRMFSQIELPEFGSFNPSTPANSQPELYTFNPISSNPAQSPQSLPFLGTNHVQEQLSRPSLTIIEDFKQLMDQGDQGNEGSLNNIFDSQPYNVNSPIKQQYTNQLLNANQSPYSQVVPNNNDDNNNNFISSNNNNQQNYQPPSQSAPSFLDLLGGEESTNGNSFPSQRFVGPSSANPNTKFAIQSLEFVKPGMSVETLRQGHVASSHTPHNHNMQTFVGPDGNRPTLGHTNIGTTSIEKKVSSYRIFCF